MKRSIEILGTDKELDLVKVVSVDTGKKFIYLEEMPDGKGWRLTYTKSLIDDISKVSGLIINRED